MDKYDIIKDISKRCGGDIYLGVVGAVRTGKSTFIKKCIENLVVPNIKDEYEKKRCLDEIPQTAQGKTIMTIEPKFVPSNAATIQIDDFTANIRLIDCVGYVIDAAKGYEDENGPRMVKTPWYDEDIPFTEAAEIGTEKVIRDHSTIGIVVTTDGSFGEIKREDYVPAENQVISELKEIGKPFIVVLNSAHPNHPDTEKLAESLREEHDVPVIPVSVEAMSEKEIYDILKEALFEFPVLSVNVSMPDWIACLSYKHPIKKEYIEKIKESVTDVDKVRDVDTIIEHFNGCEHISKAYLSNIDTANGEITINLEAPDGLYNEVLNEIIGTNIDSKAKLLSLFQEFNETKEEFSQFKDAIKMVKQTGYGTSFPTIKDMKLDTPEIIKQGTRYGVKLKAVAPSIHMIRVDVESTFEPIIGSETQSKELIDNLMKDYDNDPSSVWKSEMFGRSLDNIVQEGIRGKLSLMPDNIRHKLQTTLTKVVNKGSNNMIAIVI
ncbi:MAG TPA: stage IV sporulation protein A [Candidatus Aphodocola excrementigallinarum]|uniref:Stage IV sporulation protein A n=1 Tax=Candidatus Aphodocola excrementigallinarum TaxID=2840670 RepID=A0A9D1IP06_9FIRM|nr:stage IV sporulation protein A [Candidatus Aphodocola excrementigallinarum]